MLDVKFSAGSSSLHGVQQSWTLNDGYNLGRALRDSAVDLGLLAFAFLLAYFLGDVLFEPVGRAIQIYPDRLRSGESSARHDGSCTFA